ncbi:zinc finger protein 510 isoform X1 [Octopus bimaculoides]|uniref:C2H2-type domain-containing protein n=2 Tax=Octopus bimaculoides TaxID=37653 RepID=A0A0L8I1N6_OCTBM|nr:zinc finger protein 510 isoform X1 [Octopus bimaculoides]|eukprot:XP_014767588.1 PREDICTED: zinc finger protein 510-like isoform X1 [Octopus bimaculoides]
MEQLNPISTDVLQQFKTKLKEAIYLFNTMPDCLKQEAVQLWKVLSVAIKFSPSDQPTPSDEDLREVELQPVEEVVTSLTEATSNENDASSLMVLADRLRVTYSDQTSKLLTEGNGISSNEEDEVTETIFCYPNIDIVTCDGTGEKQTIKLPPPIDMARLCAKKNVSYPKKFKQPSAKKNDDVKLECEKVIDIESKLDGKNETKLDGKNENNNSVLRKSKRIRIRKDKTDLYFDLELPDGHGPARLISTGQTNLGDPVCIEALDIISKEVKATIQPQIEYKKKKTNFQSSNGAYTCEICGVEVQYLASLIVHRRRHSGEKPFTCSTCGRGFTTNGNKLRHEKTHSGEKPFECLECKKRFTEKKSLKVHMRSHTGERPYKCKICGRGFAQTGILQTHIYLHTGHKGHLCDTCGKAFRQKSQLRLHQKRHLNHRTFQCPETDCNASFFTKGDLQRHKLKHSGARPFLCNLCPKTFTRLQYLKEHLNQHTGTKPYSCKMCNLSFYDMSTYYRHVRRHKLVQDAGSSLELQGVALPTTGDDDNDNADKLAAAAAASVLEEEAVTNETVTVEDNTAPVMTYIVTSANVTDEECKALEQQAVVAAAAAAESEVAHSTSATTTHHLTTIPSEDCGQHTATEVYQITVDPSLITRDEQTGQQVVTTVDFSAINLLANATTEQYLST